jgi:hypothetical protein
MGYVHFGVPWLSLGGFLVRAKSGEGSATLNFTWNPIFLGVWKNNFFWLWSLLGLLYHRSDPWDHHVLGAGWRKLTLEAESGHPSKLLANGHATLGGFLWFPISGVSGCSQPKLGTHVHPCSSVYWKLWMPPICGLLQHQVCLVLARVCQPWEHCSHLVIGRLGMIAWSPGHATLSTFAWSIPKAWIGSHS